MGSDKATVRLGRRPGVQQDAVIVFPRERAFGSAVGAQRWLRAPVPHAFRPSGFVVWGVSDAPAAPLKHTEIPCTVSWVHRFVINGKDEIVTTGGFGLHYFRVPCAFSALLEALSDEGGKPLAVDVDTPDSFMGFVGGLRGLRELLMIPKHCELDFSTATPTTELSIEVSGPLDRVVAWGRGFRP